MATKRYELNEAQWTKISPLLPGKAGDAGRTAANNPPVRERLLVGSALGCALVRPAGTVRQVENSSPAVQPLVPCGCLGTCFTALADRDNQYLMIDSTIVRVISRPRAEKRGSEKIRRWGAPEGD